MNKTINFFSIIGLASAAIACNPNVYPGFDDNDAFVAFDKGAVTVAEGGKSVTIPVTLASTNGVSTTISYAAVDGTAKQGTNFELADGAATLTFTPEKRTQEIVVNIIDNPGVFTGDLKFSLAFKSTGDVNAGAENSCTVTITDLDHPLSFILGDYAGSGDSFFSNRGHFDWTITIFKDPNDVSKVWVGNLEPYFLSAGFNMSYNEPDLSYVENTFYGIVNEDKTQIIVPKGQALGYNNVVLIGFTDPDGEGDEADIIFNISPDGSTLTMPNAWGADEDGFYNAMRGGVVFSKK